MLSDFVSSHKIGLIVRISGSEEPIASRRLVYFEHLLRAFPGTIHGLPLLDQVNMVVWENPAYADFTDVGTTYERLTKLAYPKCKLVPQRVTEGDLACTALNQAVENQRRAGIEYAFIWSCEAFAYVHSHTLQRMLREAQREARAVGVILHEYDKLQRKLGWIMNTASLWNLRALEQVGDFDLRAQLPPSQYGSASTAEEVLPLIKLAATWPRCLALVRAEKNAGYIAPHPGRHPDEAERHELKVSTKRDRFNALAEIAGVAPTFLREHGLRRLSSTDL